jgi:hypothetical protein
VEGSSISHPLLTLFPSSASCLSYHSTSASPDRNPRIPESSRSGVLRQANPKDVRRLSHEVRDHPDADVILRLAHLWSRSEESGTCETVFVASRFDS